MLTEGEKRFFASTAIGTAGLSECGTKQGAVLIRGHRILSHGCNRPLIKGEKWEVSAVYDTMFAARDVDLSGSDLFCSYFPTVDDLKLIISVGIKNLYFLGKIDDKESVSLLNSFDKSRKILEVIQLEY